jgi:hypothetical protein
MLNIIPTRIQIKTTKRNPVDVEVPKWIYGIGGSSMCLHISFKRTARPKMLAEAFTDPSLGNNE